MFAADDVEVIARRLKEIEAEKREMLEKPVEEPLSNAPMWGINSFIPENADPWKALADSLAAKGWRVDA